MRERDSAEALALAREAIKLAPDLTPASALAGSLLAQKGDLRRAGRILENAWKRAPHPDLARAYVGLRHGDAAGDRLNRAKALARLAPGHAESQLAIARAALEARQFDLARRTMADLMDDGRRPTVRMCLMMADIEETEHGPTGRSREWLARASRAPRDPAWIADGIVSDRWLPASPVTGQIDAFRWETPMERLGRPPSTIPRSPSGPIPKRRRAHHRAPQPPRRPSSSLRAAAARRGPVAAPNRRGSGRAPSAPPPRDGQRARGRRQPSAALATPNRRRRDATPPAVAPLVVAAPATRRRNQPKRPRQEPAAGACPRRAPSPRRSL